MKAKYFFAAAMLLALTACSHRLKDGNYSLQVLSTNDVHSTWFDSTYVDNSTRNSLFAMNFYIDSVRTAFGPENVVLIDAGDCLQGDNAAYYYNYVDTETPHLFPVSPSWAATPSAMTTASLISRFIRLLNVLACASLSSVIPTPT